MSTENISINFQLVNEGETAPTFKGDFVNKKIKNLIWGMNKTEHFSSLILEEPDELNILSTAEKKAELGPILKEIIDILLGRAKKEGLVNARVKLQISKTLESGLVKSVTSEIADGSEFNIHDFLKEL